MILISLVFSVGYLTVGVGKAPVCVIDYLTNRLELAKKYDSISVSVTVDNE